MLSRLDCIDMQDTFLYISLFEEEALIKNYKIVEKRSIQ